MMAHFIDNSMLGDICTAMIVGIVASIAILGIISVILSRRESVIFGDSKNGRCGKIDSATIRYLFRERED